MRRSAASVELDELEQLLRPESARLDADMPNRRACSVSSSRPGLTRVEPGVLERDADLAAGAVGVGSDVDAGDSTPSRR